MNMMNMKAEDYPKISDPLTVLMELVIITFNYGYYGVSMVNDPGYCGDPDQWTLLHVVR